MEQIFNSSSLVTVLSELTTKGVDTLAKTLTVQVQTFKRCQDYYLCLRKLKLIYFISLYLERL